MILPYRHLPDLVRTTDRFRASVEGAFSAIDRGPAAFLRAQSAVTQRREAAGGTVTRNLDRWARAGRSRGRDESWDPATLAEGV